MALVIPDVVQHTSMPWMHTTWSTQFNIARHADQAQLGSLVFARDSTFHLIIEHNICIVIRLNTRGRLMWATP
jgi:hypothetical protein